MECTTRKARLNPNLQPKVGFSFLDVILLEYCVGICCHDFASGCTFASGVPVWELYLYHVLFWSCVRTWSVAVISDMVPTLKLPHLPFRFNCKYAMFDIKHDHITFLWEPEVKHAGHQEKLQFLSLSEKRQSCSNVFTSQDVIYSSCNFLILGMRDSGGSVIATDFLVYLQSFWCGTTWITKCMAKICLL